MDYSSDKRKIYDDETLGDLKKKVEQWNSYFKENYLTFHKFRKFFFDTALTNDDVQKLNTLNKPPVEFNVGEPMVNRLRGEFAKQDPSIDIRAADGIAINQLTPEFIETIDVLNGHIPELLFGSSNDGMAYDVYTDTTTGGFSVAKYYTEYINEMTFEQKIVYKKVKDPTKCGFDPLAQESHKGDGRYCFEIYAYTKDEFKEIFGERKLSEVKFTRSIGDFSWSYINKDVEIVVVCEFFYKKRKKETIVKLSTGHTILKKHYKELLERWESMGFIEAAPIVLQERKTFLTKICRYRFCENEILDHSETDYKYLPLVFCDGNSIMIQKENDGCYFQKCRPYLYNLMGLQKVINYSGQTLADELENIVQHKFVVSAEAIPVDYQDAYTNVQKASVLVYNHFYKDNPEIPLTPPREIQRTPTPPIVENTFYGSDTLVQQLLGSYDGVLGINGKQISGVAIQQGAMQSNAAADPYLVNYIKFLNRLAEIAIDMIPKYYVTPRSIPIKKPDGTKGYKIINQPGHPDNIFFDYDPNSLQVKVESGVNSTIQKQAALDQMERWMTSSPTFAAFMNSVGLPTIVDNLDVKGIDKLKVMAAEYQNFIQQQQMASMENPPVDPLVEAAATESEAKKEIEFAKLEQKQLESEGEVAIQSAKLAIEQRKVDLEVARLLAEIQDKETKNVIEKEKVDSETARSAVDAAINFTKNAYENTYRE